MTAPVQKIRVLVADDHTIVRRGFVSLLSLADGVEVVGEAGNGREAVEKAMLLLPDVVLLDINMPVLNGLQATQQIRQKAPHVKVLIVTAHDNDEYVLQVVRSGASGYLLKSTSAEDLFAAIRAVQAGGAFYSPSVSRILASSQTKQGSPQVEASPGNAAPAETRLTSREREVLQLVAEGYTHQQIASALSISRRTVDTHLNNIMSKLDIHDNAGLTTYAIKNGIVILPK